MKIRYLSHSGFEFRNGKTILIDPYFSGNRLAPKYEGTPNLILVTHEHFDHFDSKFISGYGCTVVCPQTCKARNANFVKIGKKKNVEGINVEVVSALHPQSKYSVGYVVEFAGQRIYHTGDTYLEGVKPLANVDIMLVPIGGNFTMNASEAVRALKVINPKLAIPMHYNTFPGIGANPDEFRANAEKEGLNVKIVSIGEELVV